MEELPNGNRNKLERIEDAVDEAYEGLTEGEIKKIDLRMLYQERLDLRLTLTELKSKNAPIISDLFRQISAIQKKTELSEIDHAKIKSLRTEIKTLRDSEYTIKAEIDTIRIKMSKIIGPIKKLILEKKLIRLKDQKRKQELSENPDAEEVLQATDGWVTKIFREVSPEFRQWTNLSDLELVIQKISEVIENLQNLHPPDYQQDVTDYGKNIRPYETSNNSFWDVDSIIKDHRLFWRRFDIFKIHNIQSKIYELLSQKYTKNSYDINSYYRYILPSVFAHFADIKFDINLINNVLNYRERVEKGDSFCIPVDWIANLKDSEFYNKYPANSILASVEPKSYNKFTTGLLEQYSKFLNQVFTTENLEELAAIVKTNISQIPKITAIEVMPFDTNLGIPNHIIFNYLASNEYLINQINENKNKISAKTEKYNRLVKKYSTPLIQVYYTPIDTKTLNDGQLQISNPQAEETVGTTRLRLDQILPNIEFPSVFGDIQSLEYLLAQISQDRFTEVNESYQLSHRLKDILKGDYNNLDFYIAIKAIINDLTICLNTLTPRFLVFQSAEKRQIREEIKALINILDGIEQNQGHSDYFWFKDLISFLDFYDQQVWGYVYKNEIENEKIDLNKFLQILEKVPLQLSLEIDYDNLIKSYDQAIYLYNRINYFYKKPTDTFSKVDLSNIPLKIQTPDKNLNSLYEQVIVTIVNSQRYLGIEYVQLATMKIRGFMEYVENSLGGLSGLTSLRQSSTRADKLVKKLKKELK